MQLPAIFPLARRKHARDNTTQRTPEGDLQKNTQRHTGVRMRHRGANAQRDRIGKGTEDTPPGARPSTPTAIHAHCLLLYFSLVSDVARLLVRHTPLLFSTAFLTTCCSPCGSSTPTRLPPKPKRENRLKHTTIRNPQTGTRRSTVSACA